MAHLQTDTALAMDPSGPALPFLSEVTLDTSPTCPTYESVSDTKASSLRATAAAPCTSSPQAQVPGT